MAYDDRAMAAPSRGIMGENRTGMMSQIGRRALIAGLPGIALLSGSAAAESMRVTLGTASEGGGFVLYGSALVEAMRAVDPVFEIKIVPTRGTSDNVPRLEAGDLDIGLVFGEVAHELFAGVGRPPTKLRIIAAMYSTPGMFVVRADSRYRSISDLKGRRVVWNARGSGLYVQARYVMDGLGLDLEKDFEPVYINELSEGPRMVNDGSAAALWGGGSRWPGFVAVANGSRGGRFVVPNADEIERIRAKHTFLAKLTVPMGLYRGQYDVITTVGSWSFILARADLEAAIAYRLVASIHKAERTGQLTKHLSESTVKNTLAAAGDPARLHPGVVKYFKEIGLLP